MTNTSLATIALAAAATLATGLLPQTALAGEPEPVVFDFDDANFNAGLRISSISRNRRRRNRTFYTAVVTILDDGFPVRSGACGIIHDARSDRTTYVFRGRGARPLGLRGKFVMKGDTPIASRLRTRVGRRLRRIRDLPGVVEPPVEPPVVEPPVVNPPPPAAEMLDLGAGAFWTFRWTHENSGYEAARPFHYESGGAITILLNSPVKHAVENRIVDAFPVTTYSSNPSGSVGVPAWTHLAVSGTRLMGTPDGGRSYVALYSATGSWTGLTLFDDPSAAARQIETRSGNYQLGSEWVDVESLEQHRDASSRTCVTLPGSGTYCSGSNTGSSFSRTDLVKHGIGPVAFRMLYSRHSDDGGTTGYASRDDVRVTLVSTSLQGADGWAPTGDWAPAARLPSARSDMAAIALSGRIYAVGGIDANGNDLSELHAFDPSKNEWAELSDPIEIAGRVSAVAIDGEIYATDGAALEVYTPSTDTWTQFADVPRLVSTNPRSGVTTIKTHSVAYCVPSTTGLRLFTRSLQIFEYDVTADRWDDVSGEGWWYYYVGDTGFGARGAAAVAGSDVYMTDQDGILRYRPGTSTEFQLVLRRDGWGGPRGSLAASGSTLYATGGEGGQTNCFRCWPGFGIDAMQSLLLGIEGHASAVLDGRLYVIGGLDRDGEATRFVSVLDLD